MKRFGWNVIIFVLLIKFNILYSIDLEMVVLTCSYNNRDYYKNNLLSLFNQTFTDWVCYYIDDNSQDGTYELAYEFVKAHNMQNKFIFIKNVQNLGAIENQYNVISKCEDHKIIVILDGDDQFYGPDNLSYIHEIYQDPNVWLTYGSYESLIKSDCIYYKEVVGDKNINNKDFFRKSPWFFSHLRTFYAGLFKKIKPEDLMYQDKFLISLPDLAIMYPMLEMANGEIKHFKYLDKKLY